MSSQAKKIEIGKTISYDLSLRASASEFFDRLEDSTEESILVDFTGVTSITRSFAHEYVTRRALSNKTIRETAIPENVRKMFEVVSGCGKKVRVLDVSAVKVLML